MNHTMHKNYFNYLRLRLKEGASMGCFPGNLGDLIFEAVKLTPQKVAVIGNKQSITYEQLEQRMKRAGNLFSSLGVKKGDRVALLFQNDVHFIEICFGLMRIGAIPVSLNAKSSTDILTYIIEDSGAKLLIFHKELKEKATELSSSGKLEESLLVGLEDSQNSKSYEKCRDKMPDLLKTVQMEPDDPCFLLYTSGSTGEPKGCTLTHGGQWWNADTTRKVLMLDRNDRSLVSAPLYHKNAMINGIKPILMAGGSVVVLPNFDSEMVIKAIQDYRCTYTTGVPAMYNMLLSFYKRSRKYNLSSLKFIICGSSIVPEELVRDLESNFNVEVLEAYGLTEGGPQVLVSPRWGIRRQSSAGLPLPGCEIKIVDVDKETDLPRGEIGELWVRNPGIAKEYWNKPKITSERFTKDGWLKTGDLARLDEYGYGYILGRKDDLIISGGENIYPKEIEDILLKHLEIESVAVLGKPDHLKGQVPVAFVKKASQSNLTERKVQDYFLEKGPSFAYPRKVFFLEEMPLSGTGKINKKELELMLVRDCKGANLIGSE